MINQNYKTSISTYSNLNIDKDSVKSIFSPFKKQNNQSIPLPHIPDASTNNKIKALSLSIIDHSRVSIIDDGHSLHSFASKTQKQVKNLQLAFNSLELKPTDKDLLIRKLLKKIIYSSDETKTNAHYILILLEKSDPSLSTLNHLVAKYLKKGDPDQKKALNQLIAFTKKNQITKSIPFHIKPQISKKFLLSTQTVSKITNRKIHDSFWNLKGIIIDDIALTHFHNLNEIAKLEEPLKIIPLNKLDNTITIDWLRDVFIILHNKIITPCKINLVDTSFTDSLAGLCKLLKDLCYVSFENGLIGSVSIQHQSEHLLKSNTKIDEAPFYFEGGNLIPAINTLGQKVYLCGANNILFSLLNSHYIFSKDNEKRHLIAQLKTLPPSTNSATLWIKDRLENAGLLSTFSEDEKEWIAKLTIASLYLLEKQICYTLQAEIVIVGEVFNVPIDFHLDMFLMPAPEGVIFMQDFELTCKTINSILQNTNVSSNEKTRLRDYLNIAKIKSIQYESDLKKVRTTLENASFKVITTPGVYYDSSNKCVVNFINSIIGSNMCISNGSSHPADRHLRTAFVDTLKPSGIERVYFVGKRELDPLKPFDYPAAENILQYDAGIHCLTQEIRDFTPKLTVNTHVTNEPDFQELFVGKSLPLFYQEMLSFNKHL